jgi:hypothetical protein
MDYYVKDVREGSICRIEGPMSKSEAEKYASDLNQFIHRNGPLGWLGGTVTGPFYVYPEKSLTTGEMREIRRLASV